MSIKSMLMSCFGKINKRSVQRRSFVSMPIGCELEVKDGSASNKEEIRVTCNCGATISPAKADLARSVLEKGFFIGMKCFKCGTMVYYPQE